MSEKEERGRRIVLQKYGGGKAVRPYRKDGYINVINKCGTSMDTSERYSYQADPIVPDMELTQQYEDNGLFVKIIDTPAEEALKHGYDLNINNKDLEKFVEDSLDELDWEDKAATAIKWARLYGGGLIVMLIDDGRGLEEPVDWKHVRSIDELRVFERPVVQPDYASMYNYDPANPLKYGVSRFGLPEYYYVHSIYGSFTVHESRCLVFRNGILPERTTNPDYRFWGAPEYIRLKRAIRDTVIAHSDAPKLLERSIQAVYKMSNLASLVATEAGENQVVKRLELIDLARGLLNSIAIDKDGEEYDFKTFQFSGVKDVIDATCNMLSALTNIPQTILFGRSPAGQNSTGESDFENYYNYVNRIQKLMLKRNLRTLLDVLFLAGTASREIEEIPDYKLEFSPLWSLTEAEKATVEQTKAATAQTKAQTAQIYVDMQALDPSEVRAGLAASGEFDVEKLLDDQGVDEWGMEDLDVPAEFPPVGDEPTPEGVPPLDGGQKLDGADKIPTAAATLVVEGGKVLIGNRLDVTCICGPGGHIEEGETPGQAARREAMEEFGIRLGTLYCLGQLDGLPEEYGLPVIFLCTDHEGEPVCDGKEMRTPEFVSLDDLQRYTVFPPFKKSIDLLLDRLGDLNE